MTTGEQLSYSVSARRPPSPSPEGGLDRGGLTLLAAGHFVIDMTVGALPAFLPVFTALYALSDLEAAMILAASVFFSSAIQPLFGLLADRRSAPWLLWGGVGVAALGLAAAGLASGYLGVLACVVGSGVGVAAFHPEAARVANRLAGARKATGVAWFSVGGNLGFAAGPLVAALAIPFLDERGTLVFLVPGAAACALLLTRSGRVAPPVTPPAVARRSGARGHTTGMSVLVAVVTLRTWVQFGLLAIAPLLLTQERDLSDQQAGLAVFAFSMAGALGTIAGAALADRVGGRRMLVWTTPVVAPLVAGFLVLDGAASIMALAAAGFVLLASFSVTVVMGQEYLPHRPALAAGIMIGFAAIGSAAPGLAWIGALADAAGRETAIWAVAVLPLVATALAMALPQPHREEAA